MMTSVCNLHVMYPCKFFLALGLHEVMLVIWLVLVDGEQPSSPLQPPPPPLFSAEREDSSIRPSCDPGVTSSLQCFWLLCSQVS